VAWLPPARRRAWALGEPPTQPPSSSLRPVAVVHAARPCQLLAERGQLNTKPRARGLGILLFPGSRRAAGARAAALLAAVPSLIRPATLRVGC